MDLPLDIVFNYTVISGFDKPNGKFSQGLGNAAIIDCHFVFF